MENKTAYVTLSQSSRAKKLLHNAWFAITHDKAGLVGFVILTLILLMSVTAPWLFPMSTQSDPTMIFTAPSAEHILGTDHMGRDIWGTSE